MGFNSCFKALKIQDIARDSSSITTAYSSFGCALKTYAFIVAQNKPRPFPPHAL